MSSRNSLPGYLLLCLFPAVAVVPADVVAQTGPGQIQALVPAPSGKVLLSRWALNPDGSVRSSALFGVNADGSVLHQLTPMTAGIHDRSPSWSPGGGSIVFERRDAAGDRSDIYLMNSHGRQMRPLTSGPDSVQTPVWGPAGTIAFVSESGPVQWGYVGFCLAVVRADGTQQRNLFCPAPPPGERALSAVEVSTPVWSADGTSLLVEAGNYGAITGPYWYSSVYRVDVATGATTLLTERVFDVPRELSFAPDGTNVVFDSGQVIYRVDFASDQSTRVTEGYAPLYSRDGSKIAFTRAIVDGDLVYDQLFVMNADGTEIRQLTTAQVDNLEYIAADWSEDGNQLLLNRAVYREENNRQVVIRRSLRIIDVNTGAMQALPGGHAYDGAWFQQR